jgi:DNA-binding transcriptional LysR family regulator
VALLPDRLAEEDGGAGCLVRVLPDVIGAPGPVRLVWPARERLDPKVRAFIDHAVAWAAANGG